MLHFRIRPGPQALFLEFFRRSIPQREVQLLPVAILLDELCDVRAQVFRVSVLVGINFFPLQHLEEALADSLVVRVCGPAHARSHIVLSDEGDIFGAGVLHSSVRVMHQAWLRVSSLECLHQSSLIIAG